MQPQLQQLSQRLLPLLVRLLLILQRIGVLIYRVILWIQSIKLPFNPIQGLLLIFVAFSFAYAWATPIFEASDELWHFGMVEYIHENRNLPIQEVSQRHLTTYRQEGSQPPLYYAVAAALIGPIDISDLDEMRIPNPHARVGEPRSFGNRNMVMHDTPRPVLEGSALAVYILRFFGIVLGTITVAAIYASARLIAPRRMIVALLAAGFVALNPMFLFISASVNNDNLVIMLNTAVIYLLLLSLRDGLEWKRSMVMALLIALASLTKLSALVVIPVVILGAVWAAWRTKNWRGLVLFLVMLIVFWALIAGWWYLRNVQLYGELFGTIRMAQIAGERVVPIDFFDEFQGFRIAYWGLFGAVNIQLSDGFYTLMDFVTLFSIIGVIFQVLQLVSIQDFGFARRELAQIITLIGITLLGMIAVFLWTTQTNASQGRLLFPFIAPISILLAVGLVEVGWWILYLIRPPDDLQQVNLEVVPEHSLSNGLLWFVRFLGLVALVVPFFTIAPQYAPPAAVEELPENVTQVYARYGDVALVGYQLADRRYLPGSEVPVTLYWQVIEQSERDNSLNLTLLSHEEEAIGKVDSYPGAGSLRTTTWEVGKIYPDHYQILLSRSAGGYFPMKLQIGWWHLPTQETIRPVDADDKALDAVLLNAGVVVAPTLQPEPGKLIRVENAPLFGENELIRLREYSFKNNRLILLWETVNVPDGSFSVFAHLVDPSGEIIAQQDISPLFPTQYWRWGELFQTIHTFDLTASLGEEEYQILVGWYDPADDALARLPIVNRAEEFPDAAFSLVALELDEQGELIDPNVTPDPEATPDVTDEADPNVTPSSEATAEATIEGE